jgi:seryl-tRNA synthetase
MIDVNDLRQRPEAYQRACELKRIAFDVPSFLVLDSQYRGLLTTIEGLRAEQNRANKEIPRLSGDEKKERLSALKELSDSLKEKQDLLRTLEEEWNKQQLFIPSIPSPKVPDGASDKENVLYSKWSEVRDFSFEPKDHVVLSGLHRMLDIERGVKIAGSRNYFLLGRGVQLQHAVLSLALDLMVSKGYTIMDPPHLVRYEAMMGTGYLPAGEESAYRLDERDSKMFLVGTAEVPVASYHLDEVLAEEVLPLKYAGYSPCYRREAGTYGKDVYGLYRVHQFYKVEQVIICRDSLEESEALHFELLSNAEELMQLLELPYRVVTVCSGDLGQGQVYKHDIEAWMPSRHAFGETHSCSSFLDFQSRRLKLRFRGKEGSPRYCFTLNNTLVASPRILIPLLEMHQREDGSITIPRALRPYLGGCEVFNPL